MWFIKNGSRVTGPHDLDRLRTLWTAGQFARFHLVSRDAIRWESAAPLIKKFEGAEDKDSGSSWFYVDRSRNQVGPITETALCDLLRTRQLKGSTQVCRVGKTTWHRARSVPELAPALPPTRWDRVVVVGLVVATVAGFLARYASRQESIAATPPVAVTPDPGNRVAAAPAPTPTTTQVVAADRNPSPEPKSGSRVNSSTDRKRITHAVGLLVGTYALPSLDGTSDPREVLGTGSGFVITADGYMLSNKHVVEMGTNDFVKKLKIKEFQTGLQIIAEKHDALVKAHDQAPRGTAKSELDRLQAEVDRLKSLFEAGRELVKLFQRKEAEFAPTITAFLDGVAFNTRIVFISPNYDMAILRLEGLNGPRPYFALSDQNEVPDARELFAIGFPGVASKPRSPEEEAMRAVKAQSGGDPLARLTDQQLKYSWSQGFVNRCVQDSSRVWSIEHQVETFPGNSGSPVMLGDGVVVGIHTEGHIVEGGRGKLNIAYSVAQFRKEIEAYVPDGVVWVNR